MNPTGTRRGARKLGRPPESEGAVTRQIIIDVASRHFAHKGFGGAALKEIAVDANMTSGAIYYYFDSKADLYTAVGDHWLGHVLHRYRERYEPAMNLADRLKLFLDVVIDDVIADPEFAGFWMHVDVEAPHHEAVASLRDKMWNRSVVLRTAIASGLDPMVQADESLTQLDQTVRTPGAEELPGVMLIEAFVLGIGRIALQPGGTSRLRHLLKPLRQIIDGEIDKVEAAQKRGLRKLTKNRAHA